jgi:Thiopurine S-methyltransferase (TPMT)
MPPANSAKPDEGFGRHTRYRDLAHGEQACEDMVDTFHFRQRQDALGLSTAFAPSQFPQVRRRGPKDRLYLSETQQAGNSAQKTTRFGPQRQPFNSRYPKRNRTAQSLRLPKHLHPPPPTHAPQPTSITPFAPSLPKVHLKNVMEQNASKRSFWDERYAAEKMPWDFHGIPEKTCDYIAHTPPGHVLIPGCGSAYEVAAFHDAGWSVTAIDYSPVAFHRARQLLGPLGDLIKLGDFFHHSFKESSFDLVYERAFLCTLPLEKWSDYSSRMHQLIRPGGRLFGFFLYGDESGSPSHPHPHPLTEQRAMKLFGPNFLLTLDEPIPDSLPIFAGKEHLQEWLHKSA